MAKKELTYEQALARLEQIATALEQQQTGLDTLTNNLREAQELLALCRRKLLKAETDINEILKEDGTR
ncbi:MAG: exodeoxyribonuclease VII small subunit [Alloprevotella sp.]|nr:exodeoxyribonuclease VII small subunit [Alloprevotella sp.]MDY6298141.1 exodeoxyribonuclease VII small subunit [Alloprevotella sp.]